MRCVFCSVLGVIAKAYCFMLFTVKYLAMPAGQRDDVLCPLVYGFHSTLLFTSSVRS